MASVWEYVGGYGIGGMKPTVHIPTICPLPPPYTVPPDVSHRILYSIPGSTGTLWGRAGGVGRLLVGITLMQTRTALD